MATAVLGAVTIPLLTWVFSPADIGRLYILQVVVSFSVLLLALGLDQAYIREFHGSLDRAALLKTVVAPGAALLLLLAACGATMPSQLSALLFGVSDPVYFWVAVGCIVVAFASRFLSLILRMEERAIAFSMSQAIPKALLLALIAFIVIADLQRRFLELELAYFMSLLAVFLLFGWNTRKQLFAASRSPFDRAKLRKLLKYSMPLVFAAMAYWGLTATSVFSLRAFSALDQVGLYSVSMSAAGVALIFQSIFSVVWAPIVYRWAADGTDMSRVNHVARQGLAIVLVIFVACGMFSWLIDYVLPSSYSDVKFLVLCSVVQPLLYTLAEVTGIGITIVRRTALAFWSTFVALLANVVLNVLLVPEYGASGAVVANACAFFIFFVARTEASGQVWIRFPRFKLYGFTFGALMLAVATVALASLLGNWVFAFWYGAAPIVLVAFRAELRTVYNNLRRRTPESGPA